MPLVCLRALLSRSTHLRHHKETPTQSQTHQRFENTSYLLRRATRTLCPLSSLPLRCRNVMVKASHPFGNSQSNSTRLQKSRLKSHVRKWGTPDIIHNLSRHLSLHLRAYLITQTLTRIQCKHHPRTATPTALGRRQVPSARCHTAYTGRQHNTRRRRLTSPTGEGLQPRQTTPRRTLCLHLSLLLRQPRVTDIRALLPMATVPRTRRQSTSPS